LQQECLPRTSVYEEPQPYRAATLRKYSRTLKSVTYTATVFAVRGGKAQWKLYWHQRSEDGDNYNDQKTDTDQPRTNQVQQALLLPPTSQLPR